MQVGAHIIISVANVTINASYNYNNSHKKEAV